MRIIKLPILFFIILVSIGLPTLVFGQNAKLAVPDSLIAKRTLYLVPQDNSPAVPQDGQIYFHTDNKVYYYDGSAPGWRVLEGGEKYVATRIVAASNSIDKTSKADYICDGTNDQVTIQDAINSLPVIGGAVYLLEGTYDITNNIDINRDNVTLIGTGAGTELRFQPNQDQKNAINASDRQRLLISQLQITGEDISTSDNIGIYFNNVDYSIIDRVWLSQLDKSVGISLLSGAENNMMFGCSIKEVLAQDTGKGIILSIAKDNFFYGNHFFLSDQSTLEASGATERNIFSSNSFRILALGIFGLRFTGDGAGGANPVQNLFFGNNAGDNFTMLFEGALNANIFAGNNLCDSMFTPYMALSGPTRNIITGNNFQNILPSDSSNNNIFGNRINSLLNVVGCNKNIISSNTGDSLQVDEVSQNNYLIGNNMLNINMFGENNLLGKEKINLDRTVFSNLSGTPTLTVSTRPRSYLAIQGGSSAITATIQGGIQGEILYLEGTSETNFVIINNSGNVKLGAASRFLKRNDILKLIWNPNPGNLKWIELSFSDNDGSE